MDTFGFTKIACASPRVRVGNTRYNVQQIKACADEATARGARILLTPELSLCGYTCADLFFQHTLLAACEDALSDLLSYTAGMDLALIVGLPVAHGGWLFNCAALLYGGKIYGAVPKEYLPNHSEFYEKRWFTSGIDTDLQEITLCGQTVPFGRLLFRCSDMLTVGIEICEDLWVTIPPSSEMALAGATLILNPSASNEFVTKAGYRETLVSSQSARCLCAYAYAGAGVTESTTDLVFDGAALIYENGTLLSKGKRFSRSNEVTTACVDFQKLQSQRLGNMSFPDNARQFKSHGYRVLDCPLASMDMRFFDRTFDQHPFVPHDEGQRLARCREILQIQATGLAKRLEHTGLKRCVVGISGGLDSTLALLVASETMKLLSLPASNILGVTMPGFGTTGRTYQNALKLMQALGVTIREIDIRPACLQHMQDIGHDPAVHDVTYENTQARERTQILMDLANKNAGILVGTGDLSELAMGWCTYNGDHMSMYGVNAGVPKTLVRHIVRTVAQQDGQPGAEILLDILDTPVSPELLPPDENGKIAQKTEDNIGPYELHDFFLYYFIRLGASKEKLAFLAKQTFDGAYSGETIDKWLDVFLRRFFISQFKRSCMPDGPKVGSVSLSPRGDWRMPSDADDTIWTK